jgi:hypothetical protein
VVWRKEQVEGKVSPRQYLLTRNISKESRKEASYVRGTKDMSLWNLSI